MKKSKTYSIEEEIIEAVRKEADKHPYMNASNIVEQAIKQWLESTYLNSKE